MRLQGGHNHDLVDAAAREGVKRIDAALDDAGERADTVIVCVRSSAGGAIVGVAADGDARADSAPDRLFADMVEMTTILGGALGKQVTVEVQR